MMKLLSSTLVTKTLPTSAPTWQQRIKALLPWFFCALIFYYLLRQVPPREVADALKLANVPLLFFYGLVYFLVVFIIDGYALKHFIGRFATPVSFRELSIVRGVSYLMMIINYAAAQGALAVYLKKTHNAGVAKTLGTLFLMSLTDILLVFTSALLALSYAETMTNFHGLNLRSIAFKTVPLLYLGFILWILFWKNIHRPFIVNLKRFRLVHWLLEHDLFLIFREATLKDYLVLFACRAPLLVLIIASFEFALMAFHSSIDWLWIFLYNPIAMFLTALPLTPAGLGTGQFLMIEFFEHLIKSPLIDQGLSTSQNLLFTSSLAWGLINQFYKAIFGLICLSKTSKKSSVL